MTVVCWFYRSFANSFTVCLICLVCAARVAFCCLLLAFGYAIFLSLTCRVRADGLAGVKQRLFFSLFAVSPSACLGREKNGKKLPAVLETQKKRSSRA
jgi:hypothetical protein